MTNGEKLKQAKKVITAIEEMPPADQRTMLAMAQALVSTSRTREAATILRVLEPMSDDDRTDVLRSVRALVGEAAETVAANG